MAWCSSRRPWFSARGLPASEASRGQPNSNCVKRSSLFFVFSFPSDIYQSSRGSPRKSGSFDTSDVNRNGPKSSLPSPARTTQIGFAF